MKKILPIALLSFVVFIAAAWCVGWFLQAQQIKDQVTAAMNSLDPAMGTLTADSVTTSGFPTHMSVTLTNPGATLHLKQALTQFYKRSMAAAGNSAGVLATPEYPESAYEYKLTGTVTLTINAMSDHLQVSYQGKDSMRMVSPDNTLAMSNEYDGPVKCEMRLQRDAASMFSRLWSLEKFFTQEEFGKQFREAGCQLPGSMTSDATSNQLLFSLAPSSFSVRSTPVPERAKITLNLHIKDSEVLPAGDEAYAKIMKMFLPPDETFIAPTPSLYGKQTILLDMAVDTPQDEKSMVTQPFSIQLKQFSIESAAGKYNMDFLVSSNPQGDMQQGEIAVNLVADTTPKQTEIARAMIPQMLEEASRTPQFTAMIANHDKAKLEAAVFDALPNITQLGTITGKFHLTFSGDKTKKIGSAEMKALEFSTRDYGISGNGNGALAEGQMAPAANVNLTCKNCIAMIDVLATYLQRVDAALANVTPQNAGRIAPPAQQVEGLKAILSALGVPATPESQDLTFAIKSEAGGVNVNGKTTQEVMTLVQEHLAPPQ